MEGRREKWEVRVWVQRRWGRDWLKEEHSLVPAEIRLHKRNTL